ncbi:MAG TPA: efflux RND transporter permease subunit [Longimicrobium sp.]|jgi:multidrug efflux pump subunit AcrB|uniref:efflux RND transporter permease subunit n=1 Tax=Longimicrobium sp. TaxID=2029185 RepID=UPI002EDAFC30
MISRITEFFVDRPQLTVVLFLMTAAMGFASWQAIPKAEDPLLSIPTYLVVGVYPGASAAEIEQLVVEPIEERVGELEGLQKVEARVEDGLAVLIAEFDPAADADDKYDEVLREVNALRPSLPANLHSLDVDKINAADVNIVQVALVSEAVPYHELQRRAERLEERIQAVPGVRRAESWGFPQREVGVQLNLGRLAELRIPPGQVLQAIGGENTSIPGGSVDAGTRRFSVKTSGDFQSIDEVRNTVIRAAGGSVVYLRDVADVRWGYADPTHIARYNGRRAVFVTANQQPEANISAVRDGIWTELDAFEKTLPAGVKLERGFDQSRNVEERLSHLGRDFAIAILLVLLTLLPLGGRAAGIVMVSIPLSIAMGLTALNLTGFTINQLSIVGFVIALGLLVDDSIVVVENIERFLREGHSRREAALLATRQIAIAVVGCTATLIFAFLPLIFLPGNAGKFIRVMPLAVIFTVLASLIVSLTIVPWLASRVLSRHSNPQGNVFMRALHGGIGRTYAPVLHASLARPGRTLAAAGVLLLASFALVPVVGFSLFPKAGTPQFLVDIDTPDGSSLDETDRAARFAERALAQMPGVQGVMTNVGRGNPQVYYNVVPRNRNPSVAQIFVTLDEYDARRTPAMLDSLRARMAAYPNARIQVKEFENGPPVDAPVAIRLAGPDLDTLRTLAARVEQVIRRTPGTMYVDNPVRLARTDLRVDVDEHKAGLFGIPAVEVDRTIRLGLAGLNAGTFRDGAGDEYPIRVTLPHAGTPSVEALDRVYVSSMTGAAVPLRQVADVKFESSPGLIQRHDQERSVTVTSFVRSGFNTDRVTRSVLADLEGMKLPEGYRWTAAGEIESREESFGGVGGAVIVAVFMILAILVLEFRTFRSTLIVASVIPLGFVGGIAALWLTGNTLSFTAVIGFVALIGIEIKTSILLVDFTNQLREEGVPLVDAIQQAGEVRFVPIVLTTLTAIGGLLPLAVEGSSLYSPLAWVIIGGLVSSTILARLVTPVMYKLLAPEIAVRTVPVTATAPKQVREPELAGV